MKTYITSFSSGPIRPAPKQFRRNLTRLFLAGVLLVPSLVFAAGPAPVDLGTAGRFLILSGAAITSTGGGLIYGDVGASPIDGASIGLNAAQVSGTIFAVDASGPAGSIVDPGLLTIAKGDLTTAYDDAAGRTPAPSGSFLNPALGGQNLIPGLYAFTSSALLTGGNLTLTGGPDDVWIFQVASDLLVDPGMQVILAGGAQARNIFWQVGTSATLGTSSIFKGTILADQSITMNASSVLEGRALASIAAVTFNGQSMSLPASVGDFVWLDSNLNGVQDAEEAGFSNVTVNLYDGDSNLTATVNTDTNGLYGFTDLIPGIYFLEFLNPAGTLFTLQNQGPAGLESRADMLTGRTTNFTLSAGQHDPTLDAGLILPYSSLQVIKTAGAAADGAILYVSAGTNVTYTYQVDNFGSTFLTNVVVSDNILGLIGTIPLMAPGASVVLTAVHSNILANVVNVANVQGQPIYASGEPIAVENVTDTDDADTRIELPASVGDFVWTDTNLNGTQDAGEPGRTGVVVNLYDEGSNLTATIATDANGLYGFTDLAPGTYFLEFLQPAGTLFTLQNQGPAGLESRADRLTGRTTNFTLSSGQNDPTWDAGLIASNSALQVIKTAGAAADGAVLYVPAGSNVPYSFLVENTGLTFLTNVVVSDNILGLIGTIPMMAPGASVVLTAVHSNILADVVNLATAQGTPVFANGELIAGLGDVSDTDDADTRIDLVIPSAPHIVKTANLNPVVLRKLLVYTLTVSNLSQSAVASNVTVVETYDPYFLFRSSSPAPMAGTSNIWNLGDLPPGYVTNIVITGKVSARTPLASGLFNTVALFSDWGTRTTNLSTQVITDAVIPVTLLFFRAIEKADGVLLKWETATEFDNLGFNLYRADSASGNRVRINAQLVPGANATDGQTYRFLDATARPGATYSYWLEEVAVNFKTTTYGPAIRTGSGAAENEFTLASFRTATKGGLYRIRYDALAAAGVPLDIARLGLRIKDVAVPLIVNAAGTTLQPGDSLLFYVPASDNGLACKLTMESKPARMTLADAHPVHAPGDVYLAEANVKQRTRFNTDASIVRYFLIDFTDAPVWVLDVTRPMKPILLNGYSYVGLANGLTAVYLSYNPEETGPARCFAVQDEAVIDVPAVNWR